VNSQPYLLGKLEKSPGFFCAVTLRRVARGETLVSFRGFAPVMERSRYSIQIDASHHIVTRETGRFEADDFLNHCCSPNAFLDTATLDVRALRDIEPGEEVCLNYCATEEELVEPFKCECGSPDCCGYVRGFRFLNRRRQGELKDIASPWLKAKYGL
jgi:hypothetical protein